MWAINISTDPSCRGNTDPDMALSYSSGLDVTMALGSSIALGHSLRWLIRPWTSTEPLVITEATDINSDPDFYRATGPYMANGNSPGVICE